MPKIIISDTSCLIILNKIGELELLKEIYSEITTTSDIANEYGDPLSNWVKISNVKDITKQQLLELQIDKGESSAIALAMEIDESMIILDDYKARKIAERIGLNYTGTIGVIIKARLKGFIPMIKPILEKIKRTNFRISEELILIAL